MKAVGLLALALLGLAAAGVRPHHHARPVPQPDTLIPPIRVTT